MLFSVFKIKFKFGKNLLLMKSISRRRFAESLASLVPLSVIMKRRSIFAQKKGMFIHQVYFWLKNPGNKEDKAKLVEGLNKLSQVKTIKEFYIGQPAATRRDVIDSSYDVSWLLFFVNAADQDSYQSDPIHLRFVEECSPLWQKVVVYDSVHIST
jgi:hypothetical protein